MNLKAALGWSAAFHGVLLAVHPPAGMVPPRETLHPIEVTYLAAASGSGTTNPSWRVAPVKPPKNLPPPAWLRPAEAPLPSGTFLDKNEGEAAPRTPPGGVDAAIGSGTTNPSWRVQSPHELAAPERSQRSEEASSIPAEQFASLEHKRQVREHLKAHLTYPILRIQGTVHLHLVMDREGTLKEASLVGPADPQLAETALEGARAAAPYPSFPKEMKESQAGYDFLIQYRLE